MRDIPTYEDEKSYLTHIYRHQSFYVWLCAMNCTKNELLIIRTIRWMQTIEIDVKPQLNRGIRAKLISSTQPDQPTFLKRNILIPPCALQGPSVTLLFLRLKNSTLLYFQANNAQLLIWRPTKGAPAILVHPKHLDISTIKYLNSLNISHEIK